MLRNDEFTPKEHYDFRNSLDEYMAEQKKTKRIKLNINSENGLYEVISKELDIINGSCELVLRRI